MHFASLIDDKIVHDAITNDTASTSIVYFVLLINQFFSQLAYAPKGKLFELLGAALLSGHLPFFLSN